MIQPSDSNPEKQSTLSEIPDHAERISSPELGGRFRWLFAPDQPRILLPITGLWVFLLDWLLFSSNVLSAGLATPVIVVLGFISGSVGTYFLQRRFAGNPAWKALLKAAIAGICVGMPWPVGGTLIGGWVLLFSGLGDAKSEILRK